MIRIQHREMTAGSLLTAERNAISLFIMMQTSRFLSILTGIKMRKNGLKQILKKSQ
jgi:hypothetical protein